MCLPSCRDAHEFFQLGVRGGLSVQVTRHAGANQPYVLEYDVAQPHRWLAYLNHGLNG